MKQLIPPLLMCAAFVLGSCAKDDVDQWVETKDITITAYKSDPEGGKQYLEVIYENAGKSNVSKIKIELHAMTGTKTDTIFKTIIPENILKPKDRHLAKRPIGEKPATFDDIKVAHVWVIVQK